MFERARGGQRAIAVHFDFNRQDFDQAHAEFLELVRSSGAEIAGEVTGKRSKPDPRFFIGSGKAEEISDLVKARDGEVVIVNHDLSPSQERNLEKYIEARVLDRAGLILDIFARRARSFEGKLQVELAQLRYLSTRLVRGWSHLERQKGGIGLRGPGETQLETDRRLLAVRIKNLRARLDAVRARRQLGRAARLRAEAPTVSLVGYTNAGKSTLFNALTAEQPGDKPGVYAADQLFATLDPTLRSLDLPAVENAVMADTVGFIRDLPHALIAAFRATLEETEHATLLVHVVDAADAERGDRIHEVEAVLGELDVAGIPMLEVFNKTDALADDAWMPADRLEHDESGAVVRVWVSAHTGDGLELLREVLSQRLTPDLAEIDVRLPATAGKLRTRLFESGEVLDESFEPDGTQTLKLSISAQDFDRVARQEGFEPENLRKAGASEPQQR